jgi:23S rRNA (adenine-N6)-dimethyltransferase
VPTDRRRITHAQNFLRSPDLVDRLLGRSSISPDDLVVEIGPGMGIITERLARACRQVIALEKDPALAQRLRRRLSPFPNVALFEADALAFPLPITSYKVFANLPFNATAAIISRLTDETWAPTDAYLVVQQEAAARFLGEPRETLASLLLKPWFEPGVMHRFRREDFAPVPGVEVVMLRLRKRGPPLLGAAETRFYRDLAVFAVTAWRATLRDALGGVVDRATVRRIERRCGVDLRRAPTAVPFADWLALFAAFLAEADERALGRIGGAEARLHAQQHGLQKEHRTRTPARPGRSTSATG